jgi:hypothetical protein
MSQFGLRKILQFSFLIALQYAVDFEVRVSNNVTKVYSDVKAGLY